MRTRTTAAAVVAVIALTLSACSSGGEGKPSEPSGSSAAASPSVDLDAARQGCVDAWLEALENGTEDEPAECKELSGQRTDMYMDALTQHNKAGREAIASCREDPACTSVPIP